jgi:hypothetical protein
MVTDWTLAPSELTYAADLDLTSFPVKTLGKWTVFVRVDNDHVDAQRQPANIGKRTLDGRGGTCKPGRKITPARRALNGEVATWAFPCILHETPSSSAPEWINRAIGPAWDRSSARKKMQLDRQDLDFQESGCARKVLAKHHGTPF